MRQHVKTKRARSAGGDEGHALTPVDQPLHGRVCHADLARWQFVSYRFALVLHPRRDVSPVVRTVVRWAEEHGAEVLVRSTDAHRIGAGVRAVEADELAGGCDAVLSVGGDGTMLGALRLVADRPVPVLGVHLGRLGFLVEVRPSDLEVALDRIAAGDFVLESHSALRVGLGAEVKSGEAMVAFNDLALARQPGRGTLAAAMAVNDVRYGYYRCDALVVATASGSSAYSYAAGGPLLSPSVRGIVVTPSAAMSGISRSLVLSEDDRLRLELLAEAGELAVEIDGNPLCGARAGDVLHVSVQPDAGLVVRLDPEVYQERRRVKLSLLDLPLLPEQLREGLPGELRSRLDAR
jgi:NAD+ kinase